MICFSKIPRSFVRLVDCFFAVLVLQRVPLVLLPGDGWRLVAAGVGRRCCAP